MSDLGCALVGVLLGKSLKLGLDQLQLGLYRIVAVRCAAVEPEVTRGLVVSKA